MELQLRRPSRGATTLGTSNAPLALRGCGVLGERSSERTGAHFYWFKNCGMFNKLPVISPTYPFALSHDIAEHASLEVRHGLRIVKLVSDTLDGRRSSQGVSR